jgi:hypothetical protein
MRIRALTSAVAVLALGILAGPAAAAAPVHGTISAYKHHSNGTGTLVIHVAKGDDRYYIVYDNSVCGLHRGQSGDALPGGCKNLGAYVDFEVDVVKKAGSKHSTSLVSVVAKS